MTTTNDIDAIRKLTDAATRGPWAAGVRWEDPCDTYWLPINAPSSNGEDPHQPDRVALIRYETCGFQYPHADAKADAEFIAAARTHVPALCDEVERLRADVDRLRQERSDAATAYLDDVTDLTAELAKTRDALTEANRQRTVAEATTEALKRDNAGYAAQVADLKAKLDLPCGSCHPCTNYADETWRKAGRKPPHVVTWDDTREAMARVAHLADQYEIAGATETAQKIRKALHIPTLDELLDETAVA